MKGKEMKTIKGKRKNGSPRLPRFALHTQICKRKKEIKNPNHK
jgi:hypothetical protein